MEDPEDELLGVLLKALYPRDISVAEALKYLRHPRLALVSSEYVNFWTRHVPRTSTDSQRAELLDAIAADFDSYRSFMTGRTSLFTAMGQLPADLLDSLLAASMDDIAMDHQHAASNVAEPDEPVNADGGTPMHDVKTHVLSAVARREREPVLGKSGGAAAERGAAGDARSKGGPCSGVGVGVRPTKKDRAAGATRPVVAMRSTLRRAAPGCRASRPCRPSCR